MAKIYLVRHGRAAAGFGESHDPGLDEVGRAQADAAAQELAQRGPLPILTSPLRRTRETAAPLAALWKTEPRIEEAVAEIPSPTDNLQERVAWLRQFMAGSWRNATMDLAAWREDVIAALLATREDTVIFTHFIAINVAVGAATGDDRVVVFSPDNASVTIVENDGGALRLIEKGREAPLTKVN
ncbi:MAG TPA: histidine phosphatase family protein [Rhizomicrobium sp.]|jgi:broad specificity phosphatase PhoE